MNSPDEDNAANDLRSVGQLTVDAVIGVTDVVEAMHHTVHTLGGLIGDAERGRTGGLTGFVYSNIRTITRLVGNGLDVALAPLSNSLGESESSRAREALVAAINGVLGDYLVESENSLAIPMTIRREGEPISADDADFHEALDEANGRLLLMIHGSSANDLQWERNGHNHGEALADEFGYATAYLHYNSGRHISENGEDLAGFLESFLEDAPEIEEIVILAHSMGGLVARSACHYAGRAQYSWRDRLDAIFFLASPHHGSPLERYGNWVDNILEISAYSAPFARLGKIRSAGVTDLRFGYLLHDDWRGRERFKLGRDDSTPVPLPDDVRCYAVGATTGENGGRVADQIVGDGLVPLDSALGRHSDAEKSLDIPDSHRVVVRKTGHLDVLGSDEVYQALRGWFST